MESLRESYPGPIQVGLILFPTPYKLKPAKKGDLGSGNSQLPTSARDGFMVSEELLKGAFRSLVNSNGRLLVQSNCEDVAVYMKDVACIKLGFSVEVVDQGILQSQREGFASLERSPRIPQRTADWIAMGGNRAHGPGWSDLPILHREGATETEVACALNGTPIYRCLLRPSPKD